jgi:superfamily I DNA and/or RNA helicase
LANLYVTLNRTTEYQKRLDKSVEEIVNRHPQFKKKIGVENPSEQLMLLLFPDGMPMDYFVSNLNLNESEDKKILLAIRPAMTEGLNLPLAKGCSVVAKGYWPRNSRSPVFVIDGFLEVADVDKKEYEKSIAAFVRYSDPAVREARPENILDETLASSLPLISVTTKKRLSDWYAFIEWKIQLVSEKTRGIRFINSRIVSSEKQDYEWEFDLVSETKDVLDNDRKVLGRKDISVFSLTTSENEWVFRLPENQKNKRERSVNIGQITKFNDVEQVADYFEEIKDSGWQKPQFAKIRIALSDDQENLLSNVVDGEEKTLIERLENQIGKDGFLAISAVGDLALISRHKRALDKLRDQGGLSPYLSSYLFDVKQAGNPQSFAEITEWHNSDLNSSQQEAVNKIINAPDLCLIQGPPGTGKTTVIAEAIVQLVKQGKKVLLASQAHTAVDNALDRLGSHPELRVLRLAKDNDKISEEGKNFSGVNALGRYYSSLANHAANKFLTPWKTTEEKLEKFQIWLQQAEPLVENLREVKKRLQEHEQQVQTLSAERNKTWQELQEKEARWQQQEVTLTQLKQLQKYLGEGEKTTGNFSVTCPLPELEATELVRAISTISNLSFKLTFSFADWQAEKEQRAAIMFALLEDWRNIQANEEKLKQDFQRLLASGNGGLTTPETKLKLIQIEEEIKQLEEQMESDDSKTLGDYWRQKKKEIRQLKESVSNTLDSSLYKSVFQDADIWCASIENSALLASELNNRLLRLNERKSAIELARLQLLDAITRQIPSFNTTPPDKSSYHQAEKSLEEHNSTHQQLLDNQTYCEEKLKSCSANYPIKETKVSIQSAKAEIDKLQQQLAILKSDYGIWKPLIEDWVNDLQEDNRAQKDWDNFKDTFVPACNVVAITCNEREQTLEEYGLVSFDVAIIDEVSKATPLELLLPIMRARTTVLVGDHRQLPPLFQEGVDAQTFSDAAEEESDNQNRSLLTKENLERFERLVTASLFKEHFENADESIRARLTTQFRMHPQIMKLVNHFYEGQLDCGLKNPDQDRAHHFILNDKFKKPVLTPEDHVLWIDTTRQLDGISMHKEDVGSDGKPLRTNQLEAMLTANALCQLDEQMEGKGEKLDVGVVSFYALQCKIIREEIRKLRPPHGKFKNLDVDVNTVIRYQGKEKSVIFVSLVRHDGRDPENHAAMPRRKSSRANVARYEFINVAFSRAKRLLVVFGARSMFESYEVELPNMDKQGETTRLVYKDIFQQLDRDARIKPAHQMMDAPASAATSANNKQNKYFNHSNRKR